MRVYRRPEDPSMLSPAHSHNKTQSLVTMNTGTHRTWKIAQGERAPPAGSAETYRRTWAQGAPDGSHLPAVPGKGERRPQSQAPPPPPVSRMHGFSSAASRQRTSRPTDKKAHPVGRRNHTRREHGDQTHAGRPQHWIPEGGRPAGC